MPIDYAAMTTRIANKLQSGGTADFSVAEMDAGIEDGLKEYAHYYPHIVPVVFQIESRYGICSSTGIDPADLTDTNKGQFVSADGSNEKVVYNATDKTWTVINAFTSTSLIVTAKGTFVVNDEYKIYNRQCWNKKQIYIGDVRNFIG